MFESKENNIFFKLWAWLSTIWDLVVIWEWKETLIEDFDDTEIEKQFKWTIVKFKQWVPYQTEVVNVLSKSSKNLIIQRAVEKVPMNWSSTELTQNKYQFDEWDYFYMNVTAWDFKELWQKITDLESSKVDSDNTNYTQKWNLFNWPNQLLELDEAWLVPQDNLPIQPAPEVGSFVKEYKALEDISQNKVFHIHTLWIDTSDTAKIIGTNINKKVVIWTLYWSWKNGNTILLKLSKNWTPTVPLDIRIETDDGTWKPSWNLVHIDAYGNINQSLLTTSLANYIINLNWTFNFNWKCWIVLSTSVEDNTNYYNIWTWVIDEWTISYIWDWFNWANAWTALTELIQSNNNTYTWNSSEIATYNFTSKVNWLLTQVSAPWTSWTNYTLTRISDNAVIWIWSRVSGYINFNLPIEANVAYKITFNMAWTIYYSSSSTLTYPVEKTNFTLSSIYVGVSLRNRIENITSITITPNVLTSIVQNTYIKWDAFLLTWARVSKANDTKKIKIEWVAQNDVLATEILKWIYDWVVSWFTSLVIWATSYLDDNWNISAISWSTPIWVWENISSEEIRLYPKQVKYSYSNIYYSSIVWNTTSWEFSFKKQTPALCKAWNSHNISGWDTRSNSIQYLLNWTRYDVKNVASSWAGSNYVEYIYIFQPGMKYRIRTNNTTSVSNYIDIDFQDIL